ncbi:MAG TPA: RDD family protein [Steroidobacteraceae bacterium]|nr:RDD family protein [Steroidobacteraceae bacterium]
MVGSVGFDDRVQPEVHTRLTVKAGIEMPALISEELEYVGFWPRVGAALIDTLLIMVVTVPLVTAIYGKQYWISDAWLKGPADFLINWVLPAGAVLLFWIYRQATPGKIAIGARIVDAETGEKPSTRQLVGRYLAYYVSIIPFMAGIVWVAFDPRKQGWHDKLAGTVVVRPKHRGPVPVSFASDSSSKAGSH